MIYNSTNKLELKNLFNIIVDQKYKVLFLTLFSVMITNIVFFSTKYNIYSVKTSFEFRSYVQKTLPQNNKLIIDFKKKYNKKYNVSISYFYIRSRHILQFDIKGKDQLQINLNVEQLLKLFDKEVVALLKENLLKKKEKAYRNVKPILDQRKLLQEKYNEVSNRYWNELKIAENSQKIKELDFLKKKLNQELIELSINNKSLLNSYNYFKRITIIDMNSIFHINEENKIYKPNKIKFFIFSFLFSLVFSISTVLIFFNKKVMNE